VQRYSTQTVAHTWPGLTRISAEQYAAANVPQFESKNRLGLRH